jgi:hypothetical protein
MDLEERASDPRDSNPSDGYRGFVSPRSVSGFAARRPGGNGLLVLPVQSSATGPCDLNPRLIRVEAWQHPLSRSHARKGAPERGSESGSGVAGRVDEDETGSL